MPPRWRPVPRERYHAPPETLQLFRGLDEPALSDREYAVRVLGPEHRESMLALTGLVYPEFFRARTAELGTYLGILREGRVVAMAGERLAVTGAREISAVCTHPNFTGQGMASALLSALVKRHREAGLASFLHVSADNPQARRLYERLGFTARAILKLTAVEIGG
jgi:ribosomal protein S18 acetylase RimI-like enzyme